MGGFAFFLESFRTIFFKGADKISTLRFSFVEGRRQKMRVRISAILRGGVGDKKWADPSFMTLYNCTGRSRMC